MWVPARRTRSDAQNLNAERTMYVRPYDHRGRWIVIGGTCGACSGAPPQHMALAIALGAAMGMGIGAWLNRMSGGS